MGENHTMNGMRNHGLVLLLAAGLGACGGGGGGGGGNTADALGSETTFDAGPSGGTGGSGGQVTGGGGGETGGSGGETGGTGGATGGTGGATGGSGGTGGTGGTGGVTPDAALGGEPPPADAGATDGGSVPDGGGPTDPDGSVDVVCTPCTADADCGGGLCATVEGARICTVSCAESADCAEGQRCAAIDGQDGLFCLPEAGCEAPPTCIDGDGDGFGEGAGCAGPDCDDAAFDVHPGVADPCDGRDNDCDGASDEDFAPEACGLGACAAMSACVNGVEAVCIPGAPVGDDSVCNGIDDDCDGETDESFLPRSCGLGVCEAFSACENGAETACEPGIPELLDDTTCNGIDEDCNGVEDEDFVGDVCGQGACAVTAHCEAGQAVCEPNAPLAADDVSCNGVDDNCNGETDEGWTPSQSCGLGVCQAQGVCDPAVGEVCTPSEAPRALDDTCDGLDDDCDGPIDEECGDNNFSFRIVRLDAGTLDVAIVYRQTASPLAEAEDTQPRVLNLWVRPGASLAIVPDNEETVEDERATPGAALLVAEKDLTVQQTANGAIRLVALAVNTNRIAPDAATGDAEIAILHFTLAGAAPHTLTWIENQPDLGIRGTTIAPDEAAAIMSLTDAAFGG
jgi:hypothetical protein